VALASSPTLRRTARIGLAILVGLAGAWASLAIWGTSVRQMGPFEVRLQTSLGRGETDIALPPLGRLTADTHLAPLRIEATLLDVRVAELTRLLDGDPGRLVDTLEAQAVHDLRVQALTVLAAACLLALGLALLAFRRAPRTIAVSVLAAFLAVGGAEALTLATFRADAFRSPTFSGSLRLAARVIPPVRTAEQIDAFREQLTRVVDGAVQAYTKIQTNPVGGAGEIRVLHISDLHLSPLGFDFARQIAKGFDVDFVIDTGDTTSFGTASEDFVLSDIRAFDQPYLWVRGNHDSIAFQRALDALPNTTVLDGTATWRQGLRVYGLGDPVPPGARGELSDAAFAERVRAAGSRILSDLERLPPVDIVAVHDDRMAEAVAGRVPLVVSGHFHETGARVIDGTLFLRIGTTGGSALTTFEPSEHVPLSAEVLYFEPGTPPRLIAYDVIEQSPTTGTLTVKRHLVEEEFGSLTPSPAASPTGATASGSPTAGSPTPAPVG
jgi:predicted phosphodiesterase